LPHCDVVEQENLPVIGLNNGHYNHVMNNLVDFNNYDIYNDVLNIVYLSLSNVMSKTEILYT